MVNMLDRIVKDPKLAWDASTDISERGFYDLPEEVSQELESNKDVLDDLGTRVETDTKAVLEGDLLIALGTLPKLRVSMMEFYESYLRDGCGFGTIRVLDPAIFSRTQQEAAYWMMGSLLGTPLPQNNRGDLRQLVKAKKDSLGQQKTMETGARYSETRQGDTLHTDAVQTIRPPNILGLLCLHPAMEGGDSVIVSAYSLHNRLLEERPDLLEILYNPIPFEKRDGDGVVLGVIEKPVFTFNGKELGFRYIGSYIPKGHLTNEQTEATQTLDRLLKVKIDDEPNPLVLSVGVLQSGETQFLMNYRMAHGRGSGFVDYPDPERQRVMVRSWLRREAV